MNHFQKAQLLQGGHGELGSDAAVASSGKRHIVVRALRTDHHARRMHGGVSGQTLQTFAHVDQFFYLPVRLIQLSQLRIDLQRPVDGDVQLIGNHFGDSVHVSVGKVHHPAHVADHALGRHGTEGNDLHHLLLPVFSSHIIDDLLPPFEAEVDINIRHGHTFRIQETLEQQIVTDGVDVGDFQAVSHDASRRRTAPRPHRDSVSSGVIDKIPYNQEVIHIAHLLDDGKLVVQTLLQSAVVVGITFRQAVLTQSVQPGFRGVPFRHLEMRQLRHAELDLHVAPVRNGLSVLHRLPGIGEEPLHLLFAFHIILAAFIAHPVLIRKLLRGLDAQQDIVGLFILRIRVMHVVGDHQRDIQFLTHGKQGGIHQPLCRNPMVLQLQEKIPLSEAFLVFQRRLFRLVHQTFLDVPRHLSRQAGGKGDDSLMILIQKFHIHTGLIVKALCETAADDFHQVGVSRIVLRQQDQMIIPVVPAACLSVKP